MFHSGFHSMSALVSNTRSFIYPGGQPSGSYCSQLLPSQRFDIHTGDEFCDNWISLGSWSLGMLTFSCALSRGIQSMSGHGCPHCGVIVRPSAILPAMRPYLTSASRCASPDISADSVVALWRMWPYCSGKMAQMGNTASIIKSHRGCRWNVSPFKSMGWCKKDVTPWLTHWSNAFLAQTH